MNLNKTTEKDIMEDGNCNCSWKTITIKKKFSDLDGAKNFIRENFDVINEVHNIYYEAKK